MRIIPNRTLYKCDHCNKHRLTKAAAARHELFCRHNPNNQHRCFGCQFLSVEREIVGVRANGEPLACAYQTFTCAKTGQDMYSYVAERRKMLAKLGDVERMPLACDLYEPESFNFSQHPENPEF